MPRLLKNKTLLKGAIPGCLFMLLSFFSFAQNWAPIGSGLNYAPNGMVSDTLNDLLYIYGNFRYANDIEVNGIAYYDGSQFSTIGTLGVTDTNTTTTQPVGGMLLDGNNLYVAGYFDEVGGVPVSCIAHWNGNQWDDMAGGFSDSLGDKGPMGGLAIYNGDLYASGAFHFAGGVPCTGVARWDGAQWHSTGFPYHFGSGPCLMYQLKIYNGELYVSGNCLDSTQAISQDIFKYDGSQWSVVGSGIAGFGSVDAMEVYQGELYAAGYFPLGPGVPGNCIAKWDGQEWTPVGGGLYNSNVHQLQVIGGKLYAIGAFVNAGGVEAQHIASWDGNEWCGFGSQFDNRITAIGHINDIIYIGGGFRTIDGDSITRMAKWIGGNYVDTCGAFTIGVEEEVLKENPIVIYPNPTTGQFTLQMELTKATALQLVVYNSVGAVVTAETYQPLPGAFKQQLDLSEQASGMYFIRLQTSEQQWNAKVVKQ